MKQLLLFSVITGACWAQTTISDTVKVPGGGTATGYLDVTASAACTGPTGTRVDTVTKRFAITAGAISVALEPSTTCTPAIRYNVRYTYRADSPNPANTRTAYWTVPPSVPALKVSDVESVANLPAATWSAPAGHDVTGSYYTGLDVATVGGQSAASIAAAVTQAGTAVQPPSGTGCLQKQSDGSVIATGTDCGTGTGGGGVSGTSTWAEIEAGTAGSGTITGTTTWAQIEQ